MTMLTIIFHFACGEPWRIACWIGFLRNVFQSKPLPILIFRQIIIIVIVLSRIYISCVGVM